MPIDTDASAMQRKISIVLIAVLCIATGVTLCLHNSTRLIVPAFIPCFVGSTGTTDALSAALLLCLFWIEGQRGLLFAASAYLFNTLLIVPYVLTFPGVIDASGFIGSVHSAAWLWVGWHLVFAAIILASTFDPGTTPLPQRRSQLTRACIATAACALCAMLGATLGRDRLPALVLAGGFSPLFGQLALSATVVNLAAFAALARMRPLSTLRLWLIVALAASALDTALNAIAPARYTASWYIGKSEQFVTASIVLVSMLTTWVGVNARSIAVAQRLARALADQRLLQREFEREHTASMTFQRAALPSSLPALPGVAFAAVYRPATTDALVGGDWYDAFRLADGRVVLSVGDVMGSGLNSAVTMNAARQAVRAAAQIYADPIVILDAVDRALRLERPDTIVTAVVGVFNPVTLAFACASAGHPLPLLCTSNGTVSTLGSSGLPLGLRAADDALGQYADTIALPDPSLLVFYTDGLTETRRDVIEGEARLHQIVSDANILLRSDPANEIANAMLGVGSMSFDRAPIDVQDDVAILTMRLDGVLFSGEDGDVACSGTRWTLPSNDGQRAGATRREIAAALSAAGASSSQVVTTELIYSELVGNVARHSGSLVDVVLDLSGPAPALHVLDRGPGFSYSARLPTSMMSESGRGLFIVSALAHDFCVVQRVGGGSHACAVLPFDLRLPVPQTIASA